jgi:PhnB protein
MGFKVVFGNNIHLQIYADSKAEADQLFASLSDGGKVTMPISDQFWGDYFGSLIDKFGINWMISYTVPKQ